MHKLSRKISNGETVNGIKYFAFRYAFVVMLPIFMFGIPAISTYDFWYGTEAAFVAFNVYGFYGIRAGMNMKKTRRL